MKHFTSLMLLASVAAANAQVASMVAEAGAPQPVSYAAVDAQGNVTSPWYSYETNEEIQVQNWAFKYDNRHVVSAAPNGATNPTIYNPGMWTGQVLFNTAAGFLNWPVVLNDTSFFPGSKGFPTQHFTVSFLWVPNGGLTLGVPNTSGLNPSVIVWSTSGTQTDGLFAPASRILGGIVVNFGTTAAPLANNFWRYTVGLPEGSPLSWAPGDGYLVEVRARDATGAFVPMPAGGAAQIGVRAHAGPDDPVFPGTNPSNSDANLWVDFAGDGGLTFGDVDPLVNDVDNFDTTTGTFQGRLQPGVVQGYDVNAFYANMTIDRDCQAAEDTWVPFKWIAVDGSDVPVMDGTSFITSVVEAEPVDTGEIHMIHPQLADTALVVQNRYQLYIKPKGYLAVLTNGFDMTTGSSIGNLVFKGGDIDDDNEVGSSDLSLLSGAFLTVAGEEGFLADADIDGDGEIGSSDLSCLSANFLEAGAVDPTL